MKKTSTAAISSIEQKMVRQEDDLLTDANSEANAKKRKRRGNGDSAHGKASKSAIETDSLDQRSNEAKSVSGKKRKYANHDEELKHSQESEPAPASSKKKKKTKERSGVQQESVEHPVEHISPHESKETGAANHNIGTRIFCGNLPLKIEESMLQNFFSGCGGVTAVHWVTDKETGKFYGSAFVEFDSPVAAARALELDGSMLMERPIKVNVARGPGSAKPNQKKGPKVIAPVSAKPPGCMTVFVGGLAYEADEESIFNSFSECGAIADVRYPLKDGEWKGCCFISYTTEEAADAAVQLNGSELFGRTIRVDYAANKARG